MKQIDNNSPEGILNPVLSFDGDPRTYIRRGIVLAGVLDGTSNCVNVGVITDTVSNDPDEVIEYDANSDIRLDKFDALEQGLELDEQTQGKSSQEAPTEKKE